MVWVRVRVKVEIEYWKKTMNSDIVVLKATFRAFDEICNRSGVVCVHTSETPKQLQDGWLVRC